MIKRWRRWWANRPTLQILRGATVGQLALILSLPFLSRLYEPNVLGGFAAALASAQVFAIATTMSSEQILPRIGPEARRSVMITLFGSGVIGALVFGGVVATYVNDMNVGLSAFLIASIASTNVATYASLAERDYFAVEAVRTLNGVVTATLQVGVGFHTPTLEGLVVSYALGSLIATAGAVRPVCRILSRRRSGERGVLQSIGMLGFAGRVGISTLLVNASLNLPVVVLSYIYPEAAVAVFFIVRRMLGVPTQMVSRAVGEVMYTRLVNLGPPERLNLLRQSGKTLMLVCALVAFVGVVGAQFLPNVLGQGYENADTVALILLLPSIVQLVGGAYSKALLAFGQESWLLRWSGARFLVLTACLVVVGVVEPTFSAAVAIVSFAGLAANMGLVRAAFTRAGG